MTLPEVSLHSTTGLVSRTPPRHQRRERAVSCSLCGARPRAGGVVPVAMTWNLSGLCHQHERLQRSGAQG